MRMEETPASKTAKPSMQEIELKQVVRWKRDEISGKNRMEVNEALLEEVIGDCDNYFVSIVVVGSSSRRNTKLFANLIECFNARKNALQQYRFDENKYTIHRKGVWLGSKPLMVNIKNGPNDCLTVAFLLLEVQSTQDGHREDFEIHNIFELGLLMSSVLILNFTESIDENILRWFGDSHEFVEGVVRFPERKYYAGISEQYRTNIWGLNINGPSLCSKFQSVLFLIGDCGLKTNKWSRFGTPHPTTKRDTLRKLMFGDEKFISKSSKYSRDLIFNNFDNVNCSFSSINSNGITIPDVPFISNDKDIWSYIKLLWGVPLQVKLYRKLFIWTVSLMNEDFSDVSQYVAIRSSIFQTCASNLTEFIGKLVKREFDKFWLESNIFHDGVLQRKHTMLLLRPKHFVRSCNMIWDMRSFWCTSEIRSNKFEPNVCVKSLESIMTEMYTSLDAILDTHVKDFSQKKEIFIRGLIDDSKTFTELQIGKCFEQWDNTRFKASGEIDQIISDLQSTVIEHTKSKHPKVSFETGEILCYIAEKKSKLIKRNEDVFKRISENFKRSLMTVIGSLADKLIESINNLSCNSLEEFQSLCARQKQIHEEHFKLNEVEKFCSIVVASELPKIEPMFSQVLATMTRKYVDRCVNNTFVNRSDVYRKLAIDIPLQENTISIRFGTADVKHTVFPKLQIHIMEIMHDNTINTRIILELVELGIFDTLEMERPLHGKFDLEQDRVLSLMRVIQNRNSDDIQMCLEKFCNLRSSHVKRKQFRDAFGLVFQDCIKGDAANPI